MNAVVLSPEEQIRRVAGILLDQSRRRGNGGPTRGLRPELRGLVTMIERHLDGALPPIEVAADEVDIPEVLEPLCRPGASRAR